MTLVPFIDVEQVHNVPYFDENLGREVFPFNREFYISDDGYLMEVDLNLNAVNNENYKEFGIISDWFTGAIQVYLNTISACEGQLVFFEWIYIEVWDGVINRSKIIYEANTELSQLTTLLGTEISLYNYLTNEISDEEKNILTIDYVNDVFSRIRDNRLHEIVNEHFDNYNFSEKLVFSEYIKKSVYFKLQKTNNDIFPIDYFKHCQDILINELFLIFSFNDKGKRTFTTRDAELSNLLEIILANNQNDISLFDVTSNVEIRSNAEIEKLKIIFKPILNEIEHKIRSNEKFFLLPETIGETYKIIGISNFETIRLDSCIFRFKPILKESNFSFDQDLIAINNEKFKAETELEYDENGFYTRKYTSDDLPERLMGLEEYLGDSFEGDLYYDIELEFFDSEMEFNNSSLGSGCTKYGGSYAQEVEGFSDDTIDDAFEGDPDNYWNID